MDANVRATKRQNTVLHIDIANALTMRVKMDGYARAQPGNQRSSSNRHIYEAFAIQRSNEPTSKEAIILVCMYVCIAHTLFESVFFRLKNICYHEIVQSRWSAKRCKYSYCNPPFQSVNQSQPYGRPDCHGHLTPAQNVHRHFDVG